MSTVVVVQDSPPELLIITEPTPIIEVTETAVANVIVVKEPAASVEVFAGTRGPIGMTGKDANVFYGTGLPPSPVGLPDGSLYIRYIE